jgi:hypothetical protein
MTDFTIQQREAASVRADIQRAFKLIRDAKTRYVKERLKARSTKQAIEQETLFVDLAPYESRQQLIDAYGWAEFSEKEYERLLHLWDMREQYIKGKGQYSDRVTQMLDKAAARLGDDYQDLLEDADTMARENERNQQGRFPTEV